MSRVWEICGWMTRHSEGGRWAEREPTGPRRPWMRPALRPARIPIRAPAGAGDGPRGSGRREARYATQPWAPGSYRHGATAPPACRQHRRRGRSPTRPDTACSQNVAGPRTPWSRCASRPPRIPSARRRSRRRTTRGCRRDGRPGIGLREACYATERRYPEVIARRTYGTGVQGTSHSTAPRMMQRSAHTPAGSVGKLDTRSDDEDVPEAEYYSGNPPGCLPMYQ